MAYEITDLSPNTTNTVAVCKFLDIDDVEYKTGEVYKFPVLTWALIKGLNKYAEEEEGEVSVHGMISYSGRLVVATLLDPDVWEFEGYE